MNTSAFPGRLIKKVLWDSYYFTAKPGDLFLQQQSKNT